MNLNFLGIYGLTPDQVEAPDGMFTLRIAEEKFGKSSNIEGFFSKEKQEELRKKFFAVKKNQIYKPGRFCLVDVVFSRAIQKGHSMKRGGRQGFQFSYLIHFRIVF